MTAAAAAAPPETAVFARELLARAVTTFRVVPAGARGAAEAALDGFVASPGPASYLRAARVLCELRRSHARAQAAAPILRRPFDQGLRALRAVPGVPPEICDFLSDELPLDVRAGQRLGALAALAGTYDELLGRVIADTEDMRRKRRRSPRRRPPGR